MSVLIPNQLVPHMYRKHYKTTCNEQQGSHCGLENCAGFQSPGDSSSPRNRQRLVTPSKSLKNDIRPSEQIHRNDQSNEISASIHSTSHGKILAGARLVKIAQLMSTVVDVSKISRRNFCSV